MKPAKLPYPFLVQALHLSPDDFLAKMTTPSFYTDVEKKLNEAIRQLTNCQVNTLEMLHYNHETTLEWEKRIMEECWKKELPHQKKTSLFEFVNKAQEECLRLPNDRPIFIMDKLTEWQYLSYFCGEDIFVTAMLANRTLNDRIEPQDFQWHYILRSDFFNLNSFIREKKIVENHYHLWGSPPNVDLSWIFLMNFPFNQKKKFDDLFKESASYYQRALSYFSNKQNDLYLWIQIAAKLRLILYEGCVLNKPDKMECGALKTLQEIKNDLDSGFLITANDIQSDIELYRFLNSYKAFDTVVDYAIPHSKVKTDRPNAYISGERSLYYHCLYHIYQYDDCSTHVQILFYLYLLIKARFDSIFIQTNSKTGFQNFKDYQDRKLIFIQKTPYQKMAGNMAIEECIEESHLERLEARIGPQRSVQKYFENIQYFDDLAFKHPFANEYFERIFHKPIITEINNKKFFYVVHFIKKNKVDWNCKGKGNSIPICREAKKREEFKEKAFALRELRHSGSKLASRIRGIDAASSEVNFRPENFGPTFRFLGNDNAGSVYPYYLRKNKLKYYSHKKTQVFSKDEKYGLWIEDSEDGENTEVPMLRKTYHVGEDFFDITDGLRAIDEAITFLELKRGDRIGHGVALGIDVETWYQRHPVLALPLQNRLDNMAWLLYRVHKWKLPISSSFHDQCRNNFQYLFNNLHASMNCHNNSHVSNDLLSYIASWKLRGDDPECYSNAEWKGEYLYPITEWDKARIRDKKLFEISKTQNNIYNLVHNYHFNAELKRKAMEMNSFDVSRDYINLVKELQKAMRNYILNLGIAVESCPSSNFLISNLDEFKEIPTFNLFPIDEKDGENIRLNISVNTDDQAIFYTSLQKEYTLLAGTLQQKKDEQGHRIYSDDKIIDWIGHLIKSSKEQSFWES